MDSVVLKLVASPLLIQAASLAGRRWGQSVAGWFVGLPLTSGPVAFFLALDHGTGFAAAAAAGSLAGTAAQAAFCLTYSRTAGALGWPGALALGTLAFAAAAVLCALARPSLTALLPLAVLSLAAALWLSPRGATPAKVAARPRWDIPARMAVAAALVLGLTAVAPLIGPRAAGLTATYPVFAAVLAVFAHRVEGAAAARQVLRGLLIGLFGFTAFFFVLGVALQPAGIAVAFVLATMLDLALQGATLWLIRRSLRLPTGARGRRG
jgi:hypothetical protein